MDSADDRGAECYVDTRAAAAHRSRMFNKALLVIGASLAAPVAVWAASNLNLSKSNINREFPRTAVVTASADISFEIAPILYTTPADADFLLTQVCVGPADGGVLVQAGGVSVVHIASGQCQVFTPGLILPRDAPVTCTVYSAGVHSFCTISGLVGPAPRTPTATQRP